MAEPTTRFRLIPNATATTAVDTPGERLGITGTTVGTGEGSEADFGVVDISAGAADSEVLTLLWDVTANGSNATVENFKLWLSQCGFDLASTIKFRALSGADQSGASTTQNYVANAITTSYTSVTDLPDTEPDENVWPSDEGTSMDISGGASDDAIMWAMYAAIASGETTGTYSGDTLGYELQFSFKYSYS